jgi:tetratricopeptide (TPR) repeat protein
VPTCHRVQVASILTDEDYLAAVENAPDEESRRIYQEEAARIAEIQKGILAISANEKPYDVFICYKETDANGQRTHDSQWAQDIYYGLTEQGYKVFFSRITLEDKLGQQYEPYIFAALNSAKVMVVVGSRPEYFNAVWVKNEWSRYLALMAHDRKRLLIPCYRDMDPYDLPEELSALQSQDMSKIGFMQDLLRGVQKVMNADNQAEASGAVRQVVQTAAGGMTPGINSLMERTYLFMEDGDFDSAEEYIERVLDIDPKYAPAYAAKVCVAFRIRKESGLADAPFLYEDNPDWQKALRFADSKQRAIYAGYIEKVKPRVAAQIRDYAFDCAVEMAVNPKVNREQLERELASYKTSCQHSNGRRANGSRRRDGQQNANVFQKMVNDGEPGDVSEQQLKTAAEMFVAIRDSESSACAKNCLALAEQARQKQIYVWASKQNAATNHLRDADSLEDCARQFNQIPDYKDAKRRAQDCLNDAEEIRVTAYREAVKRMEATKKMEASRKMRRSGNLSSEWEKTIKLLKHEALYDYRDAKELRKEAEAHYQEWLTKEARRAQKGNSKKNFIKIFVIVLIVAVAAYFAIAIAPDLIKEFRYQNATSQMQQGRYQSAYEKFLELRGYKDVDTLLPTLAIAVRDEQFSSGRYVTLGTYPQSANGDDLTPIEWRVLARDGNKALLISRYGLDVQPYNSEKTDVTWETCTLRTWLNNTFFNKAFTSAEQATILTTTVYNFWTEGNTEWESGGGNTTQDRIFLLSYEEANQYLQVKYRQGIGDNNRASRVTPTEYALARGAYTQDYKTPEGADAGWWWLRSPGREQRHAAIVNHNGFLFYNVVSSTSGLVRPVMWINIESDIYLP